MCSDSDDFSKDHEQDYYLLNAVNSGRSIREIAEEFQVTKLAIVHRLAKIRKQGGDTQ